MPSNEDWYLVATHSRESTREMRLTHVDHFVRNLYAPFLEDTLSVAKLLQDIEMKRDGFSDVGEGFLN